MNFKLPVTIRLLDPPLHEFLPHTDAEFAEVAGAAGVSVDHLQRRAAEWEREGYQVILFGHGPPVLRDAAAQLQRLARPSTS